MAVISGKIISRSPVISAAATIPAASSTEITAGSHVFLSIKNFALPISKAPPHPRKRRVFYSVLINPFLKSGIIIAPAALPSDITSRYSKVRILHTPASVK